MRPSEFDTATMRTSMAFMSLLVCTMAEALSMSERNITLDSGMSLWSPWKQSAISGAHTKRMR